MVVVNCLGLLVTGPSTPQWPGLAVVRRMVIAVSQWPGLAVGGGNGDSRVTVAWFGCGWGEW